MGPNYKRPAGVRFQVNFTAAFDRDIGALARRHQVVRSLSR